MKKKLKMFRWATLLFLDKEGNKYRLIHVVYVYNDYSIDSDFEAYSDDLWETWSALMEAYKESKNK